MKIGSVYQTTMYGDMEVVKYENSKKVTIKFLHSGNIRIAQKDAILKGIVKDRGLIEQRKKEQTIRSEEYRNKLKLSAIQREEKAKLKSDKLRIVSENKAKRAEHQRLRKSELEIKHGEPIWDDFKIASAKQSNSVINVDFQDRNGYWVRNFRDKLTGEFKFTRLGKYLNLHD